MRDFTDFSTVEGELSGYDACFFCMGVSSARLTEDAYRRVTYDITLAAARTLARLNPNMTFIFVSGAGADSTGQGRVMWARVKGETENEVLRLPFNAAYIFRPAFIQPLHRITSQTRAQGARAPLRDHHRADRPRHDPCRQARRVQAGSREPGHRPPGRLTTSISARPRTTKGRLQVTVPKRKIWRGGRDSNPRPPT